MLIAALVFLAGASAAPAAAPLYDPVVLNIGLSCQWREGCISNQKKAMKRALKYVRKYDPPDWRIHLCNRNAARKGQRVDWIGFDHCIRNADLRPPQSPRAIPKRKRISR